MVVTGRTAHHRQWVITVSGKGKSYTPQSYTLPHELARIQHKEKCSRPWGETDMNKKKLSKKKKRKFIQAKAYLKIFTFPHVGPTLSSLLLHHKYRGARHFFTPANNPLSLCVSPSLAPYFCPLNASFAFEAGVSPLLDTPRWARRRGPPCGMPYSVRPMEEGHPGTRKRVRAPRMHAQARTQNTRTHTQTNTAVESHHNPLAAVQVKDEWVLLEGLCLGRERVRRGGGGGGVGAGKKKVPHFPCMLCYKKNTETWQRETKLPLTDFHVLRGCVCVCDKLPT